MTAARHTNHLAPLTRSNAFTIGGQWDRKYVNVCAVYRLFVAGHADVNRAVALMARRHPNSPESKLRRVVEVWAAGNRKAA